MNASHCLLEKLFTYFSVFFGRIRVLFWQMRGAKVGSKCCVGANCRIDMPWCLTVGKRFVVEDNVYIKIVGDSSKLTIGDYVFLGRNVELDVMYKLSIGSHTVIAPGCFITDHAHGINSEQRIDQQPCIFSATEISADVWLGAGVVVLPGVKIGDGAVVGANAVVTKRCDGW